MRTTAPIGSLRRQQMGGSTGGMGGMGGGCAWGGG